MIEYEAICAHLATFLFENKFDADMKHELGFNLLCSGRKEEQLVRYYTTEYVIESIELRRPMSEIIGQMELVTNLIK